MADTKNAKEHPDVAAPKSLGYFEALKPMNIVKFFYYLCYNLVQSIIVMVFKPVCCSKCVLCVVEC